MYALPVWAAGRVFVSALVQDAGGKYERRASAATAVCACLLAEGLSYDTANDRRLLMAKRKIYANATRCADVTDRHYHSC